jgi:uncharacterized protein (DUF885 family)
MNRRDFLAATAVTTAFAASPVSATAPVDDAALRALLDSLDSLPTPAAKLKRLSAARFGPLSPGARLDQEAAREGLAIDARIAEIMPFGRLGRSPYSVTSVSGAWRELDKPDAADRIAADTARLRAEAKAGIILPREALARTIAAITKAASTATTPAAAALTEQAAMLTALQPRAPEPGMWRLPNGAEYFDLLIDRQFGGPRAADAHKMLTAKASDYGARARELLAKLGYREGSIGDRFKAAFRDPAYLYSDDDAGRDRAVADMNRWLDRAKARVPALIGPVPAECLNVAARRMTPAEQAAKKGGYRVLPTIDDKPGSYFVDLSDIRRRPSWTLPSVVHHELIPGHMIQMPIEAEAKPHPLRFDYCSAYQEGWAIHAEQMMAESGAYADDDRAELGFLHWMLFRIGRAIIDTGVHYGRWSISEVLGTLGTMQGEPAFFATFAQDVERTCLEPGTRVGEAMAWLGLSDACSRGSAMQQQRATSALLRNGRMRHRSIESNIA